MFIVKGTVYPYDIMVFWGTKNKLKKALKSYNVNIDNIDVTVGKCIMLDGNQTVIWLQTKPKDIGDLAVLQHEIFHATCFILEGAGIHYSSYTDEAFAYHIQWLTYEIYKNLDMFK